METVKMHGPSFDGSGKMVEREVPSADVKAYEAAGYVKGGLPEAPKAEKVEKVEKIEMVAEAEEAPKPKGKKK